MWSLVWIFSDNKAIVCFFCLFVCFDGYWPFIDIFLMQIHLYWVITVIHYNKVVVIWITGFSRNAIVNVSLAKKGEFVVYNSLTIIMFFFSL